MIYSLKWIKENLGISSDMIKHYEKKELLNKKAYQNPRNKYREYDERAVETLWGIKTLIGIGYSVDEIKQIISDENFDFYKSITKKVKTLEKQYHEKKEYYEFARTIKLTGRIPTVKKYGNIRFDDFLKYAKENWNCYTDSKIAALLNFEDKIKTGSLGDIELSDIKNIEAIMSDAKQIKSSSIIYAYHKIISELKDYKPSSSVVQRVVKLLYEVTRSILDDDMKDFFTPDFYARNSIPQFIDSEIADRNVDEYGQEGCIFIAKAIACFGGYDDIYSIKED